MKQEAVSWSIGRILIVALGGLLIGMGTFLVFAGYWYSFSPNGRFDWVILFSTIALLGVGLARWLIPIHSWVREGVGIGYYLTTLFSCYLVGDTYFLGHEIGMYLFCTLLGTGLCAYVLASPITMGLYLLTLAVWSLSEAIQIWWWAPYAAWGLLLFPIAFYTQLLKKEMLWSAGKVFVSWTYVIALFVVFFTTLGSSDSRVMLLLLGNLGAITVSLGHLDMTGFWAGPLRTIGLLGVIYVIFLGTFMSTWVPFVIGGAWRWMDVSLIFLTACAVIYLMWGLYRAKKYMSILVAGISPVLGLCAMLSMFVCPPLLVTVILNLYVLLVAALYAVRGSFLRRISLVNIASLSILPMILARFFDPGFTFTERGISFIVVGMLLLLANLVQMYRKIRKRSSPVRKKGGEDYA